MELQQRLDRLVGERDDYACADKESNRNKRVIALLGPSAVGKSTLIHRILDLAAEQGIDAAEAGTTGTRNPRPDDPDNYHMGVEREKVVEMIEQGRPANWSLSPTNEIYLTLPQDFPAEYNYMACLPDSLPMLRKAGFAVVHAFYIVTDAESWEEQLKERRFMPDGKTYRPDFGGRMDEALVSLQFGHEHIGDVTRIVSLPGDEEMTKTAQMILDASQRPSQTYGGLPMSSHFMSLQADKCIKDMYGRAIELAQEFDDQTSQGESA